MITITVDRRKEKKKKKKKKNHQGQFVLRLEEPRSVENRGGKGAYRPRSLRRPDRV